MQFPKLNEIFRNFEILLFPLFIDVKLVPEHKDNISKWRIKKY